MPKIEEDGKSWLRKPKLYKGVVEPYKKKSMNAKSQVSSFLKKQIPDTMLN